MESSRRDGYDGYFTWGGALLQPELWGIHPKIAISGHNPPIFTRDNDIDLARVSSPQPPVAIRMDVLVVGIPS